MKMFNNKAITITLSIITLLGLSSCQRKSSRIYNPITKKQTVYQKTLQEYAPMLSLLGVIDLPESKQKFKNHILLHNDSYNKSKKCLLFFPAHQNLPFVQYKHLLDRRIAQLKEYTFTLSKKSNSTYDLLEKQIQQLIAQLEHLNEVIVTTDEYHQEKIRVTENNKEMPFKILSFGLSTVIKKLFFA